MKKIIRNRIRCKRCGQIIESKSRHDFKQCLCGACFVDGGTDYILQGWDPKYGPFDDVVEKLNVYEEVNDERTTGTT